MTKKEAAQEIYNIIEEAIKKIRAVQSKFKNNV